MAAVLGGRVVLQHGVGQEIFGEGALRIHVAWVHRTDGAGRVSDHFAVHQSWMPRPGILSQALLNRPDPTTPVEDQLQVADSSDGRFLMDLAVAGQQLVTQAKSMRAGDVETGILADIRQLEEKVHACCSPNRVRLSPYMTKLFVAAVSVFDLRLTDYTLRHYVLLLYIVEGEEHMRAHNGVLYMYKHGAWVPWTGLTSDAAITRVHQFFANLEGAFRALQARTKRSEAELLSQLLKVVSTSTAATEEELLSQWRRSCVFGMGKAPGGGLAPAGHAAHAVAGEVEEDGEADPLPEAADDPKMPWTLHVAQNLTRVGARMQFKLQEKKMYQMFIEWCETVCPRRSGLATPDACWIMSDVGELLRPCSPSPMNHIYVFLDLPLGDGPEPDDLKRVKIFLQSTFWNNKGALKCVFAAITMAVRGKNVDRAFWSTGPGGVGQSLTSHLIAAAFQKLHAWVDMRIYFTDDEMRHRGEQTPPGGHPDTRVNLTSIHVG